MVVVRRGGGRGRGARERKATDVEREDDKTMRAKEKKRKRKMGAEIVRCPFVHSLIHQSRAAPHTAQPGS